MSVPLMPPDAPENLSRHSPLQVANGRILRNRIVIPPMASQTADEHGLVTVQTLQHYERLTQANAGLLMVEYTYVHRSGRSEAHQLGVDDDAQVDGLAKLASLIKRSGAVVGLQITHAGAKTERRMTEGVLMGPSAIAVPVKDRELEIPQPMTLREIALWKSAFAAAVDRAVMAGFDVIEFHSAHGYGLNQWLSGITNHRKDSYGGSLHGRMKLLLETVAAARLKYPKILLSVRMPGQDFISGGLQISDSVEVARTLEKSGVNFIHVSSGIGGWRRPDDRVGEGYLVAEAEEIQANVQVPVIGVGGIESGAFVDASLRAHRFELAAIGRAVLQDPKKWAESNLIRA